MIGNGVSVPVARWIGREIIRYFEAGRSHQNREAVAA